MFHALLRPEAKATQLACTEWDYFPGVDGKHWAPSAALIKMRLSSSTWPCKYQAEGCCALPARRRLPPTARSSDNVGGHCRIQPRLPSATRSHCPLPIHTRGLEKTAQSLCCNRSAIPFLLGLTKFPLHSWVTFTSKGGGLCCLCMGLWGQMEAVGYSLCR